MKSFVFIILVIILTYFSIKFKKPVIIYDDVFSSSAKIRNNSKYNIKNSNFFFSNVYPIQNPEPEKTKNNFTYVPSNCDRSDIVVKNITLNNLENVC